MTFPETRDLGGHRAEDQGRPGEARRRDPEARARRTRRSRSTRTTRPVRRSSPGWASSTWTSWWTGCAASSRSRPTSASPRWPTARRSAAPWRSWTTPTRSRPVGRASTPRCRSPSSRLDTHDGRALRVREQGHRWPHPAGVHPVRRPGHPGRHAVRRPRRLPAGRHQGDPARRRLPRRRLLGDGVQDRRLDGAQGGRPQGGPGPARADDGRSRCGRPRSLHGRRDRRHQQPPRTDPGAWRTSAAPRSSAALVPLSEMFGYVGDLRSKTQGRANYSMQFDSYAEVPRQPSAEEIIKKTRGE